MARLGYPATIGVVMFLATSVAWSHVSAAEIPANKDTKALVQLGVWKTGALEKKGDVDWWRVNLEKGKHYAFTFTCPDSGAEVRLVDEGGKTRVNAGGCSDYDPGLEFTAAVTGPRWLQISSPKGDFKFYPISYKVTGRVDCADDSSTSCHIDPGESKVDNLLWPGDSDWYRTNLRKGKKVAITTASTTEIGTGCYARVWSRTGSSAAPPFASSFVPKYNGDYYIEILARDQGDDCRITVK